MGDSFLAMVWPKVLDASGRPCVPQPDSDGARELHRRVDEVPELVAARAARSLDLSNEEFTALAHEAVDLLLCDHDPAVADVLVGDRPWDLVAGWDVDLPEVFDHATALAMTGITDRPLGVDVDDTYDGVAEVLGELLTEALAAALRGSALGAAADAVVASLDVGRLIGAARLRARSSLGDMTPASG